MTLALLLVGVIALILALFASRLSPALAAKRWWILAAGVVLVALGVALDPDFVRGFQDGLQGK